MNAVELAERAHRTRPTPEIEADLQAGARRIGTLAGAARLNSAPIDRVELSNAVEGLRRLLIEGRAVR